MIDANKISVRKLLNTGNARFKVPRYQRSFVWGKDQAVEMLEDLTSSDDNLNTTFLGTIVIHNNPKEEFLNIVDGQQRITTIFIILAASRIRAKQLENEALATTIEEKMSFINDTTGTEQGSRLIVSDQISDVFKETVTNLLWTGDFSLPALRNKKRQINKIKPIFDVFFHVIKNLNPDNLQSFLERVYSGEFVRIDIEDESEAFDIFERSNARGLELNAAELLKNYLFSKLDKDIDIDVVQEKWDRIVDYSGTSILRVLKYFYVTHKGYIQRKDLFRKLKSYGNEIKPEKLMDELEEFSLIYSTINSPTNDALKELLIDNFKCRGFQTEHCIDDFRHSLEAFQIFNITQVYPLLVSYIYSYFKETAHDATSTKKFLKTVKNLENFHFINNAITDRPGNEIEKDFAGLSRDISSNNSFNKNTDKLNLYLKKNLAPKDTFSIKFQDLAYENESLGLLYYIFDRINNYGRRGGQIIDIFNPDQRLMRRNFNIEHISPQSAISTGNISAEICHNIGNLLPVPLHTNSEMQDKAFVDKVEILREDEYKINIIKDFIKEHGGSKIWDDNKINGRAKVLANKAYDEVWKLL